MPAVAPVMDKLIRADQKAVRLYWTCFAVALGLGIVLLILTLVIPLGGDSPIPKIASGFVMLLSAPPLTLVLKRRDRVIALRMLQLAAAEAPAGSPEAQKVETIVWNTLEKMAAG